MGAGGSSDRRYQVFISSTFLDLQEERQEIIQALLELDCFPAGMELFPASNDERWDLIRSVIDDSDYYVVVLGGRYGSVDDSGVSYTEKEYDYAVSSGKPVLGFIHANPDEIPSGKSERGPEAQVKLYAFRDKVAQRMCKKWSTPSELGSVVSRSLIKLIRTDPAVGWVRADSAMTADQLEEVAELRRKLAEYELERERSRTTAPAGTEEFAGGDDFTSLAIEYKIRQPTDYTGTLYETSVDVTWDFIFGAIGPSMYNESSQPRLRQRLSDEIFEDSYDEIKGDTEGRLENLEVTRASFDKVIVQLVALRLIEKSTKKHGVNDNATYWCLTPYGETYVMGLHAVRKGEAEVN